MSVGPPSLERGPLAWVVGGGESRRPAVPPASPAKGGALAAYQHLRPRRLQARTMGRVIQAPPRLVQARSQGRVIQAPPRLMQARSEGRLIQAPPRLEQARSAGAILPRSPGERVARAAYRHPRVSAVDTRDHLPRRPGRRLRARGGALAACQHLQPRRLLARTMGRVIQAPPRLVQARSQGCVIQAPPRLDCWPIGSALSGTNACQPSTRPRRI